MLENIGLSAAFVCVLAGGFLVYNAVSSGETAWLIGGAVVLAIGAIGCFLITKEKLEWRQKIRRHYNPKQ